MTRRWAETQEPSQSNITCRHGSAIGRSIEEFRIETERGTGVVFLPETSKDPILLIVVVRAHAPNRSHWCSHGCDMIPFPIKSSTERRVAVLMKITNHDHYVWGPLLSHRLTLLCQGLSYMKPLESDASAQPTLWSPSHRTCQLKTSNTHGSTAPPCQHGPSAPPLLLRVSNTTNLPPPPLLDHDGPQKRGEARRSFIPTPL
jgi:hypothetical protein